jgi:Ca-activated chloride channel family protein
VFLNDLPSFSTWVFASPLWLLALPVVCLPFVMFKAGQRQAIALASIRDMIPRPLQRKASILRHGGWVLRSLVLLLMIVALARPQFGQLPGRRSAEGVDIMLVVDTSGSMRARDFEVNGRRPDRLEVIKAVISEFISSRVDDRIGMVVFGSDAYTQSPLTLDHDVLTQFLEQVQIGMAGDGTAIGDAIGWNVTGERNTFLDMHFEKRASKLCLPFFDSRGYFLYNALENPQEYSMPSPANSA